MLNYTLSSFLNIADTRFSSQAGHKQSLVRFRSSWPAVIGIVPALSARWRIEYAVAPGLCQPQFPVLGGILQYPSGPTLWSFDWNHTKCQTVCKNKPRDQLFSCPSERQPRCTDLLQNSVWSSSWQVSPHFGKCLKERQVRREPIPIFQVPMKTVIISGSGCSECLFFICCRSWQKPSLF